MRFLSLFCLLGCFFFGFQGFAEEENPAGSAAEPAKTKEQQALTFSPKEDHRTKSDWITKQLLSKKRAKKSEKDFGASRVPTEQK